MKLQSTNAKVINSDALDCMEEMARALRQADQILNTEFQPRSRALVRKAICAALDRYEASK